MLSGGTRIADPISGRTATLAEMSDALVGSWGGGPLLAPPISAVLSHVGGRLEAAAVTGVVPRGVHTVYQARSRNGRTLTVTGNHALLTPQGYRPLDDLAPGVEVACQWGAADIYWEKLVAIAPAGEEETFDLTVEPHHNFLAEGFVVQTIRRERM